MITKSTVLILGAGASHPYDFPLGSDLKRKIIELLSDPNLRLELTPLCQDLSNNEIDSFIRGLSADVPSIDEYLKFRISNPKLIKLGKLAITQVLIRCESKSLYEKRDWYSKLLDALTSDIDATNIESFKSNKLSIITFNYDRSLKEYLFYHLQLRLNISEEKARELLQSIRFLHIHGHLGNLKWEDPEGNEYAEPSNIDQLNKISGSIKIIHEISDVNTDARQMLLEAARIYFVGFAFHKSNLDIIGFKDVSNNGREIIGTTYDMGTQERMVAKSVTNGQASIEHNTNAKDFFNNVAPLD